MEEAGIAGLGAAIIVDKKVVWTFKDFKTFGNGLAATHVLGTAGTAIR